MEFEGEREDEVTELDVSVDQIRITQRGWGDQLALFSLPIIKFFDRPSNRLAIRLAKPSPLLSSYPVFTPWMLPRKKWTCKST
jgi:hypothetical protein